MITCTCLTLQQLSKDHRLSEFHAECKSLLLHFAYRTRTCATNYLSKKLKHLTSAQRQEQAHTASILTRPSPISLRDADLKGKRAIVTGSYLELGLESLRQLLDLLVKVILAVHDKSEGRQACQ